MDAVEGDAADADTGPLVVTLTGPRQVEVLADATSHSSRPATCASAPSTPGSRPAPSSRSTAAPTRTWTGAGTPTAGCSSTRPAVSAYPNAVWGYSEVGEVVELGDGRRPGPARRHRVGASGATRGEVVLPVEKVAGRVLPAGLDPLAGDVRPGRRRRAQRGARRRRPPRRDGRGLRAGRARPARHPARDRQRRAGRRGRRDRRPPGAGHRVRRGARPRPGGRRRGRADQGAHRRPRRRRLHRDQRLLPRAARGGARLRGRRPGRGRGLLPGRRARACASARSSTTTGCSSCRPRSAPRRSRSRSAGARSGCTAP